MEVLENCIVAISFPTNRCSCYSYCGYYFFIYTTYRDEEFKDFILFPKLQGIAKR